MRLLGIQAPETGYFKEIGGKRVWVDDPAPCAVEAKAELERIISKRTYSIALIRDGPDFDATGKRWLREVHLCKGRFSKPPDPMWQVDCRDAVAELIGKGLAREFTYQGQAYARQAEYRKAEKEARKKKLGIWGKRGCG